MKCQYVGWYSRQGCNDDAMPGQRFCNAHREQGKSNETAAKISGGCLWVFAAVVFFFLFILIVLSV